MIADDEPLMWLQQTLVSLTLWAEPESAETCGKIQDASLEEITAITIKAVDGKLADVDSEFVSWCIRKQIVEELTRRIDGLELGYLSSSEVITGL